MFPLSCKIQVQTVLCSKQSELLCFKLSGKVLIQTSCGGCSEKEGTDLILKEPLGFRIMQQL